MRAGILTIVLTGLVLLAAEQPAEARNTCPKPRGYTQVAVSGEARVFERGESAYGCHVSRDRVVGLGIAGFDYWLSGKFVLRWWIFCCEASEGPEYTIATSDLRTGDFGRVLAAWDPVDESGEALVTSAVLARNGSFAWIACRPDNADEHCIGSLDAGYRLWRVDRRGTHLLDETEGGPPLRSLRRDGRRITWRHGAERRSATLK